MRQNAPVMTQDTPRDPDTPPACVGVLGTSKHTRRLIDALCLVGCDIRLFDPQPGAAEAHLGPEGVSVADTIPQTVIGADLVIEDFPDRVMLKQKLYQRILAEADPAPLIVGLSETLGPEALQDCSRMPHRILAGRIGAGAPVTLFVDGGDVAGDGATWLERQFGWVVAATLD